MEVVNVFNLFENSHIKARNGLINWKILIEEEKNKDKDNSKQSTLIEIKDKESVIYSQYKHIIEESCFPVKEELMNNLNIHNCVRILPQDNDTSGFFYSSS